MTPLLLFLFSIGAQSQVPQGCQARCENKLSVCEDLFKDKSSKISSPYILENVPSEKLNGISSRKSGAHGREAVKDGFSEWIISVDAESNNLILKPDNPILDGQIVLSKKEQMKACHLNYKNCVKTCE